MSEMVERVARAILDLRAREGFPLPEVEPPWSVYVPEARAAIEAMREPTEAMLLNRYGEESGFEGPSVHEAKLTWRFMIDAALKEDAHG